MADPFEVLVANVMRLDAKIRDLDRQLEAEERARKKAEHQRNELLARIHRDGGHYTETHGVDESCEDADLRVATAYGRLDEAQSRIRQLIEQDHERNMALDAAVARAEEAEAKLGDKLEVLSTEKTRAAKLILTKAFEMLKSLEWGLKPANNLSSCPWCLGHKTDGHGSVCRLDQLLKELENGIL